MMKQKYLLTMALGLLLLGTTGCDDKLDTFETVGVTTAPTAIPASSISSEALPGQIKLTWTAPEGSYEYVKIRYNDPLTKENVLLLVSNKTSEVLIDETRARFGDYTFSFQTFNVNGEGSEITEITAKSGAAPVTVMETRITNGYSSDQPDDTEGNLGNAFDGDTGSFYSSQWHNSGTQFPSYIQIDLQEPCETFYMRYVNRTDDGWRTTGRPSTVDLQVSSDGESWETVEQLSGLSNAAGSSYQTDYIECEPFTHFRFTVTSNTGDGYFCISELEFYTVEIYDPETAPLD